MCSEGRPSARRGPGFEIQGPQCAFETSMFMCPAVHMSTRNLLRSSSTHEPSDPPFRVVSSVRPPSGSIGLVRSSSRRGARRATTGEVTPDRALSHAGNRVIVQGAARFGRRYRGRPSQGPSKPQRYPAVCRFQRRASSVSSFDKIGSYARHAALVVLVVTDRHGTPS